MTTFHTYAAIALAVVAPMLSVAQAQAQVLRERIAKTNVIKIAVNQIYPYISSLEPNTFKTLGAPFGGAQHGIAFAKSETQLRDAVLAAMKKLMANGTYTCSPKPGCSRLGAGI